MMPPQPLTLHPELLYFYVFIYVSIPGNILCKRLWCFRKQLETHPLSSGLSHSQTCVPLSSITLGWLVEGCVFLFFPTNDYGCQL